jgi:hypothetical protein
MANSGQMGNHLAGGVCAQRDHAANRQVLSLRVCAKRSAGRCAEEHRMRQNCRKVALESGTDACPKPFTTARSLAGWAKTRSSSSLRLVVVQHTPK